MFLEKQDLRKIMLLGNISTCCGLHLVLPSLIHRNVENMQCKFGLSKVPKCKLRFNLFFCSGFSSRNMN